LQNGVVVGRWFGFAKDDAGHWFKIGSLVQQL
jgi:hypothetical protein